MLRERESKIFGYFCPNVWCLSVQKILVVHWKMWRNKICGYTYRMLGMMTCTYWCIAHVRGAQCLQIFTKLLTKKTHLFFRKIKINIYKTSRKQQKKCNIIYITMNHELQIISCFSENYWEKKGQKNPLLWKIWK